MSDPSINASQAPILSHLNELRDRLLKIILIVGVITAALLMFSDQIYQWLSAPLIEALPSDSKMIATEVASPFFTPIKATIFVSIVLAIPVIFYQLWAFVAPGLYQNEKRFVAPLLISSTLLFYLGMTFCYFVVFPLVFGFLTHTAPEGVTVMTDISAFLGFAIKLLLAFGMTFEIPIAIILLIMSGMTSISALKQARPYIFIGCFILGMLLTPPDIFSQTLLAVPMYALFELGLLISIICKLSPTPIDN